MASLAIYRESEGTLAVVVAVDLLPCVGTAMTLRAMAVKLGQKVASSVTRVANFSRAPVC
jgi:hypothetical protein